MRTHVRVVGIINLLYSAFGLLAAAGVLLGGIFSSLATLNPIVLIVGTVTSALIALVIGALSVFGLVAGFALLNHQSWARSVVLFVSVLRLFRWPWGTLFGGYAIWVLMHDDTRPLFAMRS